MKIVSEISHNNHFKFGYNQRTFSTRKSKNDNWFVSYGQLTRAPKQWREECIETAKLIYDKTDLPIQVLFSGGLDSNVVVESFRLAKIPVSAIIVRMGSFNQHDINWALEYCQAFSVKVQILDLDVLKFWEHDLFTYADCCQSLSPQFLIPLWAIDQIDGYPVIGMGEAFLQRTINTNYIFDSDNEKHRVFGRFLLSRNRDGAPEFFKYTPEIKLSQLLDPNLSYWVKNAKRMRHLSTIKYKHELYSKHFNFPRRPIYNGFEMLQKEDAMFRSHLEIKFGNFQQLVKTEYWSQLDKLSTGYENLLEELKIAYSAK